MRVTIERNGERLVIGCVVSVPGGWRFIPHYQAKPSRKAWPTPEAAVKSRGVKVFRIEE